MTRSRTTYRPVSGADRPALEALLRGGLPTDAYLLHTLLVHGVTGFHGAYHDADLTGAIWERKGALSAAAATDPTDAAALATRLGVRERWSSVVGPSDPCEAMARALLGAARPRVDREQVFMVATAAAALGPGEPGLRPARPSELDRIVPLVARYRVEDRLAASGNDHLDWIRSHVAERIDGGRLYLIGDPEIVFCASFTFLGPVGGGLGGIYTVPRARGRGLAARATADLCRIALREGAFATLHVAPDNEPAVRCYERAGLVRAGTLRLTFR